jgi:hypothetical protein
MDEALPKGVLADIREHIDDCLSCGDSYDTIVAAEQFYSAAKERDVPEMYRASLRARLEELVINGREA